MLFLTLTAAGLASFGTLVFAAAVGRHIELGDRSGALASMVLAFAGMTLASALWIMVGIAAGAVLS